MAFFDWLREHWRAADQDAARSKISISPHDQLYSKRSSGTRGGSRSWFNRRSDPDMRPGDSGLVRYDSSHIGKSPWYGYDTTDHPTKPGWDPNVTTYEQLPPPEPEERPYQSWGGGGDQSGGGGHQERPYEAWPGSNEERR